jgi:hypothetical protein
LVRAPRTSERARRYDRVSALVGSDDGSINHPLLGDLLAFSKFVWHDLVLVNANTIICSGFDYAFARTCGRTK